MYARQDNPYPAIPGPPPRMPPHMVPPPPQAMLPGPPPMPGQMPPSMQQQPVGPPPMGMMQQQPPVPLQNTGPIKGVSASKDGRTYSLVVGQEPIRARMCGFGDKDRRPITPPPCVRLIITDTATGQEIDPNDIDSSFFVLNVDLWSESGRDEVNLVRSSGVNPSVSISTSTTTSYPPPPDRPMYQMVPGYAVHQPGYPVMPPQQMGYPPQHHPSQHPQHQMQHPVQHPGQPSVPGNYYPQPPMTPVTPEGYGYNNGYPMNPNAPPVHAPVSYTAMSVPVPQSSASSGMFTRNLIGSLAVNAFKLHDTEKKVGFWFVLQDLSVRTEGAFRLKMSFVDVGNGQSGLNTGRAQVLATCYSMPFTVYSAKKFPGVIESTPLSKAFAQQGIKIPIRKDGPKQMDNREEYDED